MSEIKFVEKINIHLLFSVTFSKNRVFYEIMSKNMVNQTGRRLQYGGALHARQLRLHTRKHTPAPLHQLPHMIARTHTHTQICNTYNISTATAIW